MATGKSSANSGGKNSSAWRFSGAEPGAPAARVGLSAGAQRAGAAHDERTRRAQAAALVTGCARETVTTARTLHTSGAAPLRRMGAGCQAARAAQRPGGAPGCAPSSMTCSLDVNAPPENVFCAKLITVLPPSAPAACRGFGRLGHSVAPGMPSQPCQGNWARKL